MEKISEKDVLIEQHNAILRKVIDLRIVVKWLESIEPERVMGKQEVGSFGGGKAFRDITAKDHLENRRGEVKLNEELLDIIKKMLHDADNIPL